MENGNIVIYQSESGLPEIQVTFENETLWLSQRLMAELFEKDSDTIGFHIKNIYSEGELVEKATTEFFSVVQNEGKRNVRPSNKPSVFQVTFWNQSLTPPTKPAVY